MTRLRGAFVVALLAILVPIASATARRDLPPPGGTRFVPPPVAATHLAHHPDFNGDGYADAVLQGPRDFVPGFTPTTSLGPGDVWILYGGPHGANTGDRHVRFYASSFGQTPVETDSFGQAVATGDFNGDGFDDLAIGAPGVTVNGHTQSGAVAVVYGSATGLSSRADTQWFTEATSGMGTHTLDSAAFGSSLAAGDFNHDGRADLAIGSPGQQLSGVVAAGAVFQLFGTWSGLSHSSPALPIEVDESTTGVPGNPERFDAFGTTLVAGNFNADPYADLAVDVFGRNVNGARGAGAVDLVSGTAFGLIGLRTQFLSENSGGVPGAAAGLDHWGVTLAAADVDGDGLTDLFVGNPEKKIKAAYQAGAVMMLRGARNGLTSSGGEFLTLGNAAYSQVPATNDIFGAALAPFDVDGDGHTDLAIGVSGRTSPQGQDFAGEVVVMHNVAGRLSRSGGFVLSGHGGGFASGLEAGDFNGDGRDDVAVSRPGLNVSQVLGAGAVQIFNSAATSFATNAQQFTQNTLGGTPQEAAAFGWGHLD